MDHAIEKFISRCSEMNFGKAPLSEEQKTFFRTFHGEIPALCNSLPESTRSDALFFLMEYLGVRLDREFNFFLNYYSPAWSIIYWLAQTGNGGAQPSREDMRLAITAHSMALLLHPLDDHLNDGQLPATHLNLLIRSQAWMTMVVALNHLADGVEGGREMVDRCIDDYYSGINHAEEMETLDAYCDLFRKQMATWMAAPVLLTKKISDGEKFTHEFTREFTRDIQSAYGSFGVAWRLLDDIKDLETDMLEGARTAVYMGLPEEFRRRWRRGPEKKDVERAGPILEYILKHGVVERIKERMREELASAERITEALAMKGLAGEFRSLSAPLESISARPG